MSLLDLPNLITDKPSALHVATQLSQRVRRDRLVGKLVATYGTIVDGPGAMVIVDVDPGVGAAIAAVVASSDGVQNVKAQRVFSMDEVMAIRQKRVQLQASYRPPGQ